MAVCVREGAIADGMALRAHAPTQSSDDGTSYGLGTQSGQHGLAESFIVRAASVGRGVATDLFNLVEQCSSDDDNDYNWAPP